MGVAIPNHPPYMYSHTPYYSGETWVRCATPETKRGYPFRQNQVRVAWDFMIISSGTYILQVHLLTINSM